MKFKKGLLSIFFAVCFGTILGRIVFGVYDSHENFSYKKIYLVSVGRYDDYDSMVKNTSYNKYIYYEDEGTFNMIIGYTENYDNINKIRDAYGDEVNIYEYYSRDKDFNDKVYEYDIRISKSNNNEEIKGILLDMIGLYKNNDNSLTDLFY